MRGGRDCVSPRLHGYRNVVRPVDVHRALRDEHNNAKRVLIDWAVWWVESTHVPLVYADVCCGKGGDVPKVSRHPLLSYTGSDVVSEAVAEARRRAGPPSLSDVSEGFFDDIDVNDWLMDLDHAAVLVQANWRAIACRQALLRAVRHASAAAIQTRYREHRRAMRLWDAALGRRKRGYY